MPRCTTTHFGEVDYGEDRILQFPNGLPAFEDQHRFLFMERPQTAPFVFLQSLELPDLAFVAIPAPVLAPSFRVGLGPEERRTLRLPEEGVLESAGAIVCLAIVTFGVHGATANLLAPVVINTAARLALQFVPSDSDYGLEHPLPRWGRDAECF